MKTGKRILTALAALVLLSSLIAPAYAAGGKKQETEPEPERISIGSLQEFLDFAEACTETAYSENRIFSLECSINLNGSEFEPIPYFSGIFQGNGNSISGLTVDCDGSRQGLFRVVAEGAEVCDLSVAGSVTPSGTGIHIGGIAGVNEGSICSCSFQGTVSGRENIGGIAGSCGVNSLVENCRVSGSVSGEHFVGGVCGSSDGVLRGCSSEASVNTIAVIPEKDSNFDLSEFDLSEISSDDYLNITDLGGICGRSTGVIADCSNTGDVGYHYTGYNVGGIVGLTGGFVTNCSNSGTVLGRKDTGGIAGQLVPSVEFNLEEGKFDDIEQSIKSLNGSIGAASALVSAKTGEIGQELDKTADYTSTVITELRNLMEQLRQNEDSLEDRIYRDPDTGEIRILPGTAPDTFNLGSAIANLSAEYGILLDMTNDAAGEMLNKLIGVTSSISAVMSNLNAAMQNANLEIEEYDLSVEEAYDHDLGAVEGCVNRGDVISEGYAGGVVGSIGYELDFDKENLTGLSDYFVSEVKEYIFAVVRSSESYGRVETKNDCAGGVVGCAELGAVHDSTGAGYVVSLNGGRVGGIAGTIQGTVMNCSARPVLSGQDYVGGIAGEAENIRGCCVYAAFDRYGEYAGAVAGWTTGEVSDNLYVKCRPAGVDGISYTGTMQAVSYEELLEREDLPDVFREISVRFIGPDGKTVQEVPVDFGGSVTQLPEMPMDGVRYWLWDVTSLENIYHSTEVRGDYYNPVHTLSTGEEIPAFLVEGNFYDGQVLTVTDIELDSADGRVTAHRVLVTDYEGSLTVRMFAEGSGRVLEILPDGSTRELSSSVDGRYRVFTVENGAVVLFESIPVKAIAIGAILGAAAGAAVIVVLVVLVRRRKTSAQEEPAMTEDEDFELFEPEALSSDPEKTDE